MLPSKRLGFNNHLFDQHLTNKTAFCTKWQTGGAYDFYHFRNGYVKRSFNKLLREDGDRWYYLNPVKFLVKIGGCGGAHKKSRKSHDNHHWKPKWVRELDMKWLDLTWISDQFRKYKKFWCLLMCKISMQYGSGTTLDRGFCFCSPYNNMVLTFIILFSAKTTTKKKENKKLLLSCVDV